MSSFVYFIRPVGQNGPIKIGCSGLPKSRLHDFTKWSPIALEIVALVPGSYELERSLHSCFAHVHRHFEWFEATEELLAGIAALQRGAAVEAAFDLTKKTGSIRSRKERDTSFRTAQWRERRSYSARLLYAERKSRVRAPEDAWKILHWNRSQDCLTSSEKQRIDEIIAQLGQSPRLETMSAKR